MTKVLGHAPQSGEGSVDWGGLCMLEISEEGEQCMMHASVHDAHR